MPDNQIKIAMITRPNLYSAPGGDTVQILKTAETLKALYGVDSDIIINGKINYTNYSLIHFFNIICPEDILGHIYHSPIPFIVSTIYVDYREYDRYHRKDMVGKISRIFKKDSVEYFKTLVKYLFKNEKVSTIKFFFKGHSSSIKYIINKAELLLPNSSNEYNRLLKDYLIEKAHWVIPNAIDPSLFKEIENIKRDLVLCVGRIEGNKNQLNIIRALKNTKYTVVFIGTAAPNQKTYYEQCKSEADSNMKFLDFIPQKELVQYYNRAKVHVLASWFETTGLSNLEAGVMGCNLVIGNRGDVKDYFEDYAFYCEPGDLNSIKKAIDNAWNSDVNNELKNKILQQYTWTQTAQLTYEAYKSVLKNFPKKTKDTK
jgi:glycosyltransferase involved in cell wall biosynthesis